MSSINAYHVVIAAVLGFAIGGVISAVVTWYVGRHSWRREAQRHELLRRHGSTSTVAQQQMQMLKFQFEAAIQNDYGGTPEVITSSNYDVIYSSASLKSDKNKLTVKEATVKHNTLVRTSSMMRSDLNTIDHQLE